MGQRHQAFVIARIRPHGSTAAKYRCIAAIHHQWCYGRLPLLATHRFLKLVRQPRNAEIVQYEIDAIHGQYGRFKKKPAMPKVPCPFVSILLQQAFSVELSDENSYKSMVHVEPAGMHMWGGGI
jgi:hypothetical protein